jgi:hypothetical protein
MCRPCMCRPFFGQIFKKGWTADTVRRWHILCHGLHGQVLDRRADGAGHDVNLFVGQDNDDGNSGRVES